MIEQDDLIIWSDQSWCYGYELWEYQHMSDDYVVVPESYPFYFELIESNTPYDYFLKEQYVS